jgi:hypothetical protein
MERIAPSASTLIPVFIFVKDDEPTPLPYLVAGLFSRADNCTP